MKNITEYLNINESEFINEASDKDKLIKKLKTLKAKRQKLWDDSDELFASYSDEGEEYSEENFWNNADKDALKKNTKIEDELEKVNREINKVEYQLTHIINSVNRG